MFVKYLRASAAAFVILLVCGGVCSQAFAHASTKGARSYFTALKVLGQDTVRLFATERGHGRPVLLLHGLGASSYSWRKVLPALSRHNRVIALDLKGFGRSQKPFDLAYRPGDHARLVEAFIKKRGLRNITLIGHSFGGAVALITLLHFNRSDPGRIRDLVLISAPAYRQPKTEFVNFLHTPVLPYVAFSLVPPELATWMSLSEEEARYATAGDIRAYARPYYDPAARHALITTSRQIIPHDVKVLTALYPTISQRTLILWCDRDPTVPLSKGIRLARTIPHARLKVFRGCGHAVPDERPGDVVREVYNFLNNSR